MTGTDKPTADLLCNLACSCKGEKQVCVDAAIKAMPKTPENGLCSEVAFQRDGTMYRQPNGAPMTRTGVPGSRLDVIKMVGGQPAEFIEMKFAGDRWRSGQQSRYEAISRAHGRKLQEIMVERDCRCTDDEQKQTQTAPQTEGLTTGQKLGIGAGALGVIGVIACAIAEPCGAAALGVLAVGSGAALATAP